ncbi:MAG TPA: CHAT domain-containing tetratricopeptide repeat protein [Thermoanaerobaculia bacterium]|nr:CHAT domain-containing tetratricopeptide repeat protein [Thermoanaerobaculia bacterium]
MKRLVFGLAVALAMAGLASGQDAYPLQGMTPPQKVGGYVSIPGAPLPPVPVDTVRMSIWGYRKFLWGLRVLGDSAAVGRGLAFLATMHAAVKEYEQAEERFDEAQRILESKESRRRNFDLAWVHNNRGLVQMETGEYAEGVRSFRTAVSLMEESPQEAGEPHVIVMQNLAAMYSLVGDLEHSEEAYLQALDMLRRLGKEGSRPHRVTRGNLAILYASMGDFAAARVLLEKLAGEPGLDATLRFQVLSNLGYVLSWMKDFPEAERRLLQAKKLTAEGSGGHALVLMNLTAMHTWAQNFDRAEAMAAEALPLVERLYGEKSRMVAAVKGNMGSIALSRGEVLKADRLLVEARRVLVRGSGDEDAYLFATRALALVAQRRGQQERAAALSREALELSKRHLDRILAFGSEAQRLAYLSQASPFDQLGNFGDAALLADAVLSIKGAVLESLLAERALTRRSRSEEDRERLDRIRALRVQILEKVGRGERADDLQRLLKREETALAKKFSPRIRRVEPDRVRASLTADQVLAEIVRYQRYAERGKLVPAYGAVVIPPAGAPSWVPLGDAETLEPAIGRVVYEIQAEGAIRGIVQQGKDISAQLHELHDRLWMPLARALPAGTREVVLSPDGATSFLPWAALMDESDRFVAERWQVTQVASGRDLLRTASPGTTNTILALADGGGDLPFTRQEVEDIAAVAQRSSWQATLLIGEDALEQELLRRPRPRILHLATHGGQLTDGRLSHNPMYRGYLLLAGGNETLRAWKRGDADLFAVDGVLTAEEASVLDLSDTWLTVLSACETGAGEARLGEGVLGLRRGFALAGSQNLLFSLWRVSDPATAVFMKAFYERLFQRLNPAAAFHETQRELLVRWKEEAGVIRAAYRAGAFVLTR